MAKSKKASQVPKQISQQRKASVETKAAIASIVQEPAPVVQEPTPVVQEPAPVVQEPAIAFTRRRRSQRRQTFAEKLESVITEEQAPVVQEPIALTPTPKRTSQRKQTVAEKPASVITEEQAPAVADEPVQMAEDPVPIAEEPVVEAPQVEFVSRNPELVQKPRMSAAKKAGIIFPPTRMRKALKSKGYGNKVYRTAGVYAAAAIEYLVAEILELASNVARDHHVVRITPRHIMLAIRHDDELNQLIGRKTVLAKSGVVPNIHSVFLPKTKTRRDTIDSIGIAQKKKSVAGKKKSNTKKVTDDENATAPNTGHDENATTADDQNDDNENVTAPANDQNTAEVSSNEEPNAMET